MALVYGVSGAGVSGNSNPIPGPAAYYVSGPQVTLVAGVSQPSGGNTSSQFLANDANTVILTSDSGAYLLITG